MESSWLPAELVSHVEPSTRTIGFMSFRRLLRVDREPCELRELSDPSRSLAIRLDTAFVLFECAREAEKITLD